MTLLHDIFEGVNEDETIESQGGGVMHGSGYDLFIRNFGLTLSSGRNIYLKSLDQRLTYGDLLEGLPRFDHQRVESLRKNIEKEFACPVVVVDASPFPLPLSQEERDELKSLAAYQNEIMAIDLCEKLGRPRPRTKLAGELSSLAPVTCIARFESTPISDSQDSDGSQLTMIWYQQSFAMPIEERILQKINDIEWDHYAENFGL